MLKAFKKIMSKSDFYFKNSLKSVGGSEEYKEDNSWRDIKNGKIIL